MNVLNIIQNSQEWLEFRLGKSGGSGLKSLIPSGNPTKEVAENFLIQNGVIIPPKSKASEVIDMLTPEDIGIIKAQGNKKDEFFKLVAERVARPITPNDYIDRLGERKFTMMERGHLLEEEAIAQFELRTGKTVDKNSVVWQREDNENSILSPDGSITTVNKETGEMEVLEAIEVKCLDSHRMIRAYYENTYPDDYHTQVVKYFIANEKLQTLHFVMYTDVMPALPYLQFDISREDVENDIRMMKSFEDEILRQVEELTNELGF